jgi:hypothetical protein
MTFRLFSLSAILLLFVDCSVGTSSVPKGYESQKKDADKIDSIIKNYITGVYKLDIDGPNLNLTVGLKEQDISHYRRRGFYIDRLLYEMSNYMDSIHYASIKVTNLNDLLKPHDTYTYSASEINDFKEWQKKDPIYFYFMSLVSAMDNDKYEEFASISRFINKDVEGQIDTTIFDPDLAYYIDKFVSEIYGETKGLRQRQIMEAIYECTFDPDIKAKYAKPLDILLFTNYADSIYYLKTFPNEMKLLLGKRLKPDIKHSR